MFSRNNHSSSRWLPWLMFLLIACGSTDDSSGGPGSNSIRTSCYESCSKFKDSCPEDPTLSGCVDKCDAYVEADLSTDCESNVLNYYNCINQASGISCTLGGDVVIPAECGELAKSVNTCAGSAGSSGSSGAGGSGGSGGSNGGSGGLSGASGSAGNSGSSGTGATSGSAGSAGNVGGTSGSAGSAATGGDAGSAGSAAIGGSAGSAGSAAVGGSAGNAGVSGGGTAGTGGTSTTPPGNWSCNAEYYYEVVNSPGTQAYCDCNCTAYDPDCDDPQLQVAGCNPGQQCNNVNGLAQCGAGGTGGSAGSAGSAGMAGSAGTAGTGGSIQCGNLTCFPDPSFGYPACCTPMNECGGDVGNGLCCPTADQNAFFLCLLGMGGSP